MFHSLILAGRCLIFVCVTVGATWASAETAEPFEIATYLKQCGGKYFPACNDFTDLTGTNQWSMFDHAQKWAKQQGKKVLAISGYDWCPPCIIDLLSFTSDGRGIDPRVVAEAQKGYVVLTVDRDMWGAADVLAKLGMPKNGFHEVAVYDPVTSKPVAMLPHPNITFGNSLVQKCDNVSKSLTYDYGFNARLEFLKDPTINPLDLVMDRNRVARESCSYSQ
ncbi:MAG: hypothetical protein AB7G93_05485 [Bdellovibrionales bacterium]